MPTNDIFDNAEIDALALTQFLTQPSGASNLNSAGNDIGTLADVTAAIGPVFHDTAALLADTVPHGVGTILQTANPKACYRVVAAPSVAHLTTSGNVGLWHVDGPYVIAISGQSNAAGVSPLGPNPASALVKTWDKPAVAWGGSDRTQAPWTHSNPDGNQGNANYALARAHHICEQTGRPTFIIFDAQGGSPIADWILPAPGNVRFQSLSEKIDAALATPDLAQHGITQIDEMIFAQGEADFESDFGTHLAALTDLMSAFRSMPWASVRTPFYMMAPSALHTRYQWRDALKQLCSVVDSRCYFVPLNGLETEFSTTGQGDNSHFLGMSVWHAGYDHIARAAATENTPNLFYGRGSGPADASDPTALATFSSLVSRESWTDESPPNGPAASGSISWGRECFADGNYTYCLGHDCSSANVANYGLVAGHSISATATTDYFAGFGFQNTLEARYVLASGRGHVVADEGGTAVGLFSQYASAQADPVLFQVGAGSSTSNRKNAFCVRKSGALEVKNLPLHADNTAAIAAGLSEGSIYHAGDGLLRLVI